MATSGDIDRWVRRYLKAGPPRSKSLMITIFGDSIAPRGRGLWLSELIELLRPFQVSERLARTSTFRLAEEGWLESRREGRRSRYSLTRSGIERIRIAHCRIYDPLPRAWDGNWTVVILGGSGNHCAGRAELKRELQWEGFGSLAPGIVLHPCADRQAVRSVLARLRLTGAAVVLEARDVKALTALTSSALLAKCWKLDELASLYQGFLHRFEPLLPIVDSRIGPQSAFTIQTLLIHSFRRVALHDPRFPRELMPKAWPGLAAYECARALYMRTFERTDQYLRNQLSEPWGRAAKKKIAGRFGGIIRTNEASEKLE